MYTNQMSSSSKSSSKSYKRKRALSGSLTPNNEPTRGGRRKGAGRPKGSGRFKEATQAIRVPISTLPAIKEYLHNHAQSVSEPNSTNYEANKSMLANQTPDSTVIKFGHSAHTTLSLLDFPIYSSKVAAGIPSPAEDHVEDTIDLNQYLVDHPESTYMLRVEGESMVDAGILANDILVVDRSLAPKHKKIVIASVNGQLTVKRLYHRDGVIKLIPENKEYPIIELENESDLVIWGVVVGSFRKF